MKLVLQRDDKKLISLDLMGHFLWEGERIVKDLNLSLQLTEEEGEIAAVVCGGRDTVVRDL